MFEEIRDKIADAFSPVGESLSDLGDAFGRFFGLEDEEEPEPQIVERATTRTPSPMLTEEQAPERRPTEQQPILAPRPGEPEEQQPFSLLRPDEPDEQPSIPLMRDDEPVEQPPVLLMRDEEPEAPPPIPFTRPGEASPDFFTQANGLDSNIIAPQIMQNVDTGQGLLQAANDNPLAAESSSSIITNTSTRSTHVAVGNVNVDARGSDAKEISANVGDALGDQMRQTMGNFDDGVAI